jgi:hypothetical protein
MSEKYVMIWQAKQSKDVDRLPSALFVQTVFFYQYVSIIQVFAIKTIMLLLL